MILGKCDFPSTTCFTCSGAIAYRSTCIIRIRRSHSSVYYHLHCYRPKSSVAIHFADFTVQDAVSQSDSEELKGIIKRWNRQLLVHEAEVPAQFLANSVPTAATASRRQLIEIFTYLTVKEISTSATYVCKEWLHISRDEELWKTRYLGEFQPQDTEPEDQYRRKYIAHYLNACWNCKRMLTEDTAERKCPFYKRPVCKKCADTPSCKIIALSAFTKSRLTSTSTINSLSVPKFLIDRMSYSFVASLAEKLLPYAESRRSLLLSLLETTHNAQIFASEISEIRYFDLKSFYYEGLIGSGAIHSSVVTEAMRFCGTNEKSKKLEKNVGEFLAAVKKARKWRQFGTSQ